MEEARVEGARAEGARVEEARAERAGRMSHTNLLLMMVIREQREREEREREERERLVNRAREILDAIELRERLAVRQQQYLQQQQQQQQQQYYGYGAFDYARGHQQQQQQCLQLCDDEDQAKHEVRVVPRKMKCPNCDGVGKAWRDSSSWFCSQTYDTCAQCNGRGTLEVSVESPRLVARKHHPSVFTFSF